MGQQNEWGQERAEPSMRTTGSSMLRGFSSLAPKSVSEPVLPQRFNLILLANISQNLRILTNDSAAAHFAFVNLSSLNVHLLHHYWDQ